MVEPAQRAAPSDKPFVEHLDDLRRALIGAAGAIVVGLAFAIPLAPWIIKALKFPLLRVGIDPDSFVRVIRVGDGFGVATQVVTWSGLILSLPGIFMAAASFIYPGLTPHERRVVTRALILATVLFAVGVLFGYFTTIGLSVVWLLKVNEWLGVQCEFIELADYCGYVLRLLLGFGLVFELPVLVVALGAVGLVSSRSMREKRRHVVVGLMVVAMILTPPDVTSMLVMTVPLVLLYEISIWVVRMREKKRGVV